jgi:hypothetical protein
MLKKVRTMCGVVVCCACLFAGMSRPLLAQAKTAEDPFGDGVSVATTKASAPQPVENENKIIAHGESVDAGADLEKAHELIRKKLSQKVSVLCPEIELGRVLEMMSEKLKVSIMVDPVGLEESGVTRDQILSVQHEHMSARASLRLMLKPLALTYVIEDETLKITSQDIAAKSMLVKVYDCRDLLTLIPQVEDSSQLRGGLGGSFGGGGSCGTTAEAASEKSPAEEPKAKEYVPNGYALSDTLLAMVDPDSWIDNGGTAGIESFAGLLIIRQTEENHEKIERILGEMRRLTKSDLEKSPPSKP